MSRASLPEPEGEPDPYGVQVQAYMETLDRMTQFYVGAVAPHWPDMATAAREAHKYFRSLAKADLVIRSILDVGKP